MTDPAGAPGYRPDEHYDRVTGAWIQLLGHELHYGLFTTGSESLAEATAALTDRMLAHARLRPGDHVLDVGCGTGTPACRLAVEQEVRVTGITTSAVGVRRATEHAARDGIDTVEFLQRDGMANGFAEETFDCVWVLESSHLMRDRDALMAECARVLRPGGRMVLCDLVRRREIPFLEVRDRREEFTTLRAAFGDARMEPLDYYAGATEANGLVVDTVEDLTDATLPTFDHWRRNAEEHASAVAAVIGREGLDAFRRSTDILRQFWQEGSLGYGLVAAHRPA